MTKIVTKKNVKTHHFFPLEKTPKEIHRTRLQESTL